MAVLGARGFIGSAVVAAAEADPRVSTVRSVLRAGGGPGSEVATADVRDRDRLRRALDGVDVVVNAAHVIGSGPDLAVNEVGPGLVAETAHAGGARCLEIGTAAVYGRGPLRGGAEGDLTPRPDSALSASRAAGEARALDAGAVVLRPMIVVGRGDRWAVPAAAAAAAADTREPTARVGAIDVDELARLVVSVALASDPPPVLHAARPGPTRLADLLASAGYRPRPEAVVEGHVRAMLHTDRWVDAELAWELAGWEPEGPLVGSASRRWYGSMSA